MVRIPFVQRYSNTENQHCKLPPLEESPSLQLTPTDWIAMIVLCSHIETGVGLIAPSLPHVRRFFLLHGAHKQTPSQIPNTDDIVTIGRLPYHQRFHRDAFRNPTDVGISLTTIQARAENRGQGRMMEQDHSDRGDLLKRYDGEGIRADRSYIIEFERGSSKSSNHTGECVSLDQQWKAES